MCPYLHCPAIFRAHHHATTLKCTKMPRKVDINPRFLFHVANVFVKKCNVSKMICSVSTALALCLFHAVSSHQHCALLHTYYMSEIYIVLVQNIAPLHSPLRQENLRLAYRNNKKQNFSRMHVTCPNETYSQSGDETFLFIFLHQHASWRSASGPPS